MSIPSTQTRIVLRNRPRNAIDPELKSGKGTFQLETSAPVSQNLQAGQCLIKNEWLSLDPAMRGWLNDSRSYIEPVQIGAVMRAGGVGKLVKLAQDEKTKAMAEKKGLKIGDWVSCMSGWQEFATNDLKEVSKITVNDKIPATYYLGALGMPMQTAYWGCMDVLKIKAGELFVCTGAAGAVGSVAVQIAKAKGCRVVGIAGGPDKCKWLREDLGVEAIDYKSKDFKSELKKIGYIDAIFDNVGGTMLDLLMTRLKRYARIALCGAISDYNTANENKKGLQMYLNLISQEAKIQGFIVFSYAKRYHEAEKDVLQMIAAGKMQVKEHKLIGLEKAVEGLMGLFEGVNTGKMMVKVSPEGSKL